MQDWTWKGSTVLLGTLLALGFPQTGHASRNADAHPKVAPRHAVASPKTTSSAKSQPATTSAQPQAARAAVSGKSASRTAPSLTDRIVASRGASGFRMTVSHGALRGGNQVMGGRLIAGRMMSDRTMYGRSGRMMGGRAMNASFRTRYAGISCVPFARSASGIDLKGNAANWWDAASGVYARGTRPEPGSVLNFRATGHMRLGHVAVVAAVLNPRLVEIDHANWAGPGASRGGVSRGIPVMDVSENNDWSRVRVGLGHSGDFGSEYPTYGFIYDRPDRGGSMMARSAGAAEDEVAEAPGQPAPIDAANRSIR